jgi:argininosuccinate lyase
MRINEKDPADEMMKIKSRLWHLATEQRNKGNMAMHYVLEDLHVAIEEIIAENVPVQGKE